MPSLSMALSILSTAGLVALGRGHLRPTLDIPNGSTTSSFCVKSGLKAILAGCATYSFWTTWFNFPSARYNNLGVPTAPLRSKSRSLFGKFFLQHIGDIVDLGIVDVGTKIGLTPGKVQVINMMRGPRVFTGNAEDIDYIFNKRQANYKKGRPYQLFKRFFGEGLLTILDDQVHKVHRRIAGPAFSPKALRHLADVTVPTQTGSAVAKLKADVAAAGTDGAKFKRSPDAAAVVPDMQDWLDGLTFGVITQAAFKTQPKDEGEIKKVHQILERGFAAAFSPARMVPFVEKITVRSNWRAARERENARDLIRPVIKEARSQQDQGKVEKEEADALIDYLVHADQLSDQQIADHGVVFMFAGFETTSTALGWLLWALAKDPSKQEKLLEEVSAAISLGTCPKMDDIQHCSYLSCACKEILRHRGPVAMLSRDSLEDDVLPGSKTFLAKGSNVMCVLNAMHHNPEYWGPDAEEFRPERWEEPGFDAKHVGVDWMPFIVGKRNCIGKDFAMHEMQLILAQLIRNFEFSWPEDEPDAIPFAKVTTRAKTPFRLNVRNRTV